MLEREQIQFIWMQSKMAAIAYPKSKQEESVIQHSAMVLSYNEKHEQANWVMHIIMPDVIEGNFSRSNDFREDTLVTTGSAREDDYFIKTMKPDSSYSYDGYGYDRGHMAPSADFKWSQKALSESFLYSNMSPQLGDFNRMIWAQLEGWLRAYVERNNVYLIVVTAPVLHDSLPSIERSPNHVSIPQQFVKVVFDEQNQRAIAFIMPNQKIEAPIESFAVSIDSAETVLGYDLFSGLSDDVETKLENDFVSKPWLPDNQQYDVVSLTKNRLPKKTINATDAKVFIGDNKKHTVCGKVVSTKKHEKGHVFINLDKQFPNQIFSVTIFDSNIKNFHYEPEVFLKDKEVCFTGEIGEYKGVPSMELSNEKQVRLLGEF